jgi:hypothetical protein
MPGNTKEIAGVVGQVAKGVGEVTIGSSGMVVGTLLDPLQAKTEVMDLVKIGDRWSGTWGKEVPPGTHPVQDQIFATGHDFFHTLTQEGLTGVGGFLLINLGFVSLVIGAINAGIGTLRLKNM